MAIVCSRDIPLSECDVLQMIEMVRRWEQRPYWKLYKLSQASSSKCGVRCLF